MEEALGPELCRALREVCLLTAVRPDRWHQVPAVARVFETAAVMRLAKRLDGETGQAAIERAAIRLGLSPATALSRLERWFRDSRQRAA